MLFIVGSNVLLRSFGNSGWAGLVNFLFLLLFVFLISPVLIAKVLPKADIDPGLRDRLLTFVREQGYKVRGLEALRARSAKQANALFVGFLPWFRYILVTDYLIEGMEEDEIRAIVAHEVGHGKKRHLYIKLGVPLLALMVMAVPVALAAGVEPRNAVLRGVLVVATPILFVVTLVFLQGLVGLRLEYAADDFARRAVGLDAITRALEKLAQMNMAKRNTGRFFNLLTQHPAIDQRLQRLRQAEGSAGAG